jgi:hypothetical protein
MKRYINLKENEELIIGTNTNKKNISIKNENNILHINKIEPCVMKDNIEITEINIDELKKLILFEMYYQETSNNDKTINDMIDKILDYHYQNVYGKEYINALNIKDTTLQVITTFEEN